MDCCFWLIPLCFLLASGIFVRVGYQFYKDRRPYRNWIGFLLMFIGVAWPFLLCGGIKLVGELTYRDLGYDKIWNGMTGDEVRAGWGEPYEAIPSPDGKQMYWHYKSSAIDIDGIKVIFDEHGRVVDFYSMGR